MYNDLGWLLILSLATWRVTSLIVIEDGPFGVLEIFRNISGRIPQIRKMTDCILCTSVWVGLGFSLAYVNGIKNIILYALAFSAGAIVIDKAIEYLSREMCGEMTYDGYTGEIAQDIPDG